MNIVKSEKPFEKTDSIGLYVQFESLKSRDPNPSVACCKIKDIGLYRKMLLIQLPSTGIPEDAIVSFIHQAENGQSWPIHFCDKNWDAYLSRESILSITRSFPRLSFISHPTKISRNATLPLSIKALRRQFAFLK